MSEINISEECLGVKIEKIGLNNKFTLSLGKSPRCDWLAIYLKNPDLVELLNLLKTRPIGKFKVGKTKGLIRDYVLYEREDKGHRIKLEVNRWLLIFQSSLGGRISREDSELLQKLISTMLQASRKCEH